MDTEIKRTVGWFYMNESFLVYVLEPLNSVQEGGATQWA